MDEIDTVDQPSVSRLALGRYGEGRAVDYLRSLGMRVLARNWRTVHGELDVIAADGGILVVCEVKTRSGLGWGSPLEAITSLKRSRLRRLALEWLEANSSNWRARPSEIRIDAIGVLVPRRGAPVVQHVRGI